MKVLTTVWALFDDNIQTLNVSRNGGAIMIYNICEYMGRKVDSYVFVGSRAISESEYNHIHITDNSRYLPDDRSDIVLWQQALQKRFEEILEELQPDYVLVQGGGDFSSYCISTCRKKRVPFSFVDHLYMGKAGEDYTDPKTTEWENKEFSDPTLRIIAVGTAMKRNILRDYPELKDVCAIPNGTPYHGEVCSGSLAEKYSLDGKKVLLCSGSLQPRKNQLQLVRAFAMLPESYKRSIRVLFCGKDSARFPTKDLLLSAIKDSNLEDMMFYIGTYPMDEMKKVYSVADALIMPSLSEGLSLVALEMLTYGKPVIMFADNETAGDVYDCKVAVLARDHSDQSLADAIMEWYDRDWDDTYITEYSNYFSMERVADDYIEYCDRHMEV